LTIFKKNKLTEYAINLGADCAVFFDMTCSGDQEFIGQFNDYKSKKLPIAVQGKFYDILLCEISEIFQTVCFLLKIRLI